MKCILITMLVFSFFACKKSSEKKEETLLSPSKAALTAPGNNAVCLEGEAVSNSISAITFSWQAAEHTDSYEVVIKNLKTGESISKPASGTQLITNLDRNTPYSWYVVSKSNGVTQTSQSEVWKFYNAGIGTVSYAPFPADNLLPANSQAVNAVDNKISMSWSGEDADSDIKSYDVLFGQNATNLSVFKADLTAPALTDVIVVAGTTYYWQVITKDAKGNTSSSELHYFKVN